MSSVVLNKGIEEPWASEGVARFINSLAYKEITLKSDTEPAIIAFINRVVALCKADVTTEDAVEGDKESNGLIENAVMLLRGIIQPFCPKKPTEFCFCLCTVNRIDCCLSPSCV